jgi:hypothetical protein
MATCSAGPAKLVLIIAHHNMIQYYSEYRPHTGSANYPTLKSREIS